MKHDEEAVRISGKRARGGEIVLRKWWQRSVFIGGLVGLVVFAAVLRIAGFF